jgi:pimeloyl-ACP methyl ester carboxylesterase
VTGQQFEVDGVVGERWPGSAQPVVLLHAGVTDRRAWHQVASALEGPVVAYDRRGFGDSAPARSAFSHLDDLWLVLDAVTDGAVWLVGNSAGGALALDAALSCPERVLGIVLIAPAISGAPEIEDDTLDPATAALAARFEAAGEDSEELARLDAWLWLDGPSGPEGRVSGAVRELALDMNRRILQNGGPDDAGGSGIDAWSRLEEVKVQATIVSCALDIPAFNERNREVAARVRGAQLRELAGVAHLPSLEQPDVVAALIESVRRET